MNKGSLGTVLGSWLVLVGATGAQQPHVQVAPGFQLRPDAVLEIGAVTAEVLYYDNAWLVTQQHDRFEPDSWTWSPAGGGREGSRAARTRVVAGRLRTAHGPVALEERFQPVSGGIRYLATLTAVRPLPTNELSLAFYLPLDQFAGKQLRVDGLAVSLPAAPRARGRAVIFSRSDAGVVELPMPTGTLVVTGRLRVLVQDDREWGDRRFALRLLFTPGSGSIRQSGIDLRLTLNRSGRVAGRSAT
jgi:hypothetical protein